MHYYDDPDFSYPAFWNDREYEHGAEILAIQKLLGAIRVDTAVDIGGGFGRLVDCISHYARRVILVEPSEVQRKLVTRFAPGAIIKDGNSEETGLPTKSCDLVVMIRVAHHVPNLEDSLHEAYRILKPGGHLILEFANSANFKSRLRHFLRFRSVPLLPTPVSVREVNIPFVNHHPASVMGMIRQEGFTIQKTLSASNFRSPLLKKIFKVGTLLGMERFLQRPLSTLRFGPSIFILARRPATLKSTGLYKSTR
ncbi:MAG: class I SAM-dependent methyltransferase [Patescibacteria group bacterium]|nr:class I SAM-dependent methyltransferase [Patescibacteria group bacterium]